MFEQELRGAGLRMTNDRITLAVTEMVVSREPVTQRQFNGVLAMVSAQIRTRFELSQTGAEQAVKPILRRLIPVLVSTEDSTRRMV